MKIFEFKNFDKRDIVITIPKRIKWSDYQKELEKAESGEILNFKVPNFPNTSPGCKCYIIHDGIIKGWMNITGMSEKNFKCSTTGKKWSGKFIERSGKFYKIKPIKIQGFMGYRYFDEITQEQ